MEADETYIGGKEANKHMDQKLHAGRGTVGKTAVAGVKDRASGQVAAQVVPDTTKETLQDFVSEHVDPTAEIFTDEHKSYTGLPNHTTVSHSAGEWVKLSDLKELAHTNGMESFWSMLKCAFQGVYHQISKRHLDHHVQQFVGKHNLRDFDTIDQLAWIVAGFGGKRLTYDTLIVS